jgi:hypothetical protein
MASLRRISIASLLFVTAIGAPAFARSRQSSAKEGDLLVYYCQNLSIVTVRVLPKQVEVVTPARRATLAEMIAPSPVRYSNGSVTLSSLEEHVRFEEPGAVYWCRSLPVEVPWQDARLRGIEFSAAGDSPAWLLEVDAGVAIEFAAGVGAARTVTKFPAADFATRDGRMTLTARSGSHALTVAATPGVCHLAGSTMTLSVAATLDGQTYNGCGRALTLTLSEK